LNPIRTTHKRLPAAEYQYIFSPSLLPNPPFPMQKKGKIISLWNFGNLKLRGNKMNLSVVKSGSSNLRLLRLHLKA